MKEFQNHAEYVQELVTLKQEHVKLNQEQAQVLHVHRKAIQEEAEVMEEAQRTIRQLQLSLDVQREGKWGEERDTDQS